MEKKQTAMQKHIKMLLKEQENQTDPAILLLLTRLIKNAEHLRDHDEEESIIAAVNDTFQNDALTGIEYYNETFKND